VVSVKGRGLGRFKLHALDAGLQHLDGGAMFGVVPRDLWKTKMAPDERNRIPLAMRPLLVETEDQLVLIDTGAGNKEDEKFLDIYGIENAGNPTALEDSIRAAGFAPADVTLVINTHLHFDHAGGDTLRRPDGRIAPSFPGVRHVVQEREWEFAHIQNERIKASYLLPNFEPVHEAGLFDFVAGERQIVPGIRVIPTPGHTPGHQSVLLESEGESALYIGDLVPTTAHLPLPWIMGYDVEPLVTLETKRAVLGRATRERTLLIFEHDPEIPWGYLAPQEKRPTLVRERPD
jgi:glyoxylase-like metal-dependent hydrolase (beta-lactamase superfamily II)